MTSHGKTYAIGFSVQRVNSNTFPTLYQRVTNGFSNSSSAPPPTLSSTQSNVVMKFTTSCQFPTPMFSNYFLVLSTRNTFKIFLISNKGRVYTAICTILRTRVRIGVHFIFFIVILSWKKIGFLSFSRRLKCLCEHENVLDNDSIIKSSFTFTIIINPLHNVIVVSKTRNA